MAEAGAKPRAVLLDVMPQASRDTLAAQFDPDFDFTAATSTDRGELLSLVRDAEVLLAMWGAVDGELIRAANAAKVIQKLGVGTDKIDTAEAEKQGIAVLKAAGINADAVAETAVLLILAVARHLMHAVRTSREGHFEKEELRAVTFQLTGKTVGLFGLGNIGQALARRLHGFGVEIIYHDLVRAKPEVEEAARARFVSFEELLASSDILSLHVPSTPQTAGLFNADTFARMKPGSILINTARGSLVNEDDLAEAVREGQLLGAGLDVTSTEPLPPTSPLFDLERVVVTPHIAGAVGNNFPNVAKRAYDNVTAVLAGDPVPRADVVVPPKGGRRS